MDSMHNTAERQLAAQRFERIFCSTRHTLFNYIRKFVGNIPMGVEDVLQECYVSLWENLHQLQDDEKILPLLKTYAVNYCINQLKKYAKEQQRAGSFYSQRDLTTNTYHDLHFKDTLKDLNETIASLPPQRRLIYQLVREKGLSHQEISTQLNISTKTIERHINEAMRTLRGKFTLDKLIVLFLLTRLPFLPCHETHAFNPDAHPHETSSFVAQPEPGSINGIARNVNEHSSS